MTPPDDIGPLRLKRRGPAWRLSWVNPAEPPLELPADYEAVLTRELAEMAREAPPESIEMDLQQAVALSSRQLGVLIALHKALAGQTLRLPLVGVSDGVRRVLEMTRTARFFEIRGG